MERTSQPSTASSPTTDNERVIFLPWGRCWKVSDLPEKTGRTERPESISRIRLPVEGVAYFERGGNAWFDLKCACLRNPIKCGSLLIAFGIGIIAFIGHNTFEFLRDLKIIAQ